jgi:SAM-dependent methyltransferase
VTRVADVRRTRARLSGEIPDVTSEDISDRLVDRFQIHPRESARRRIVRRLARTALRVQQTEFRRTLGLRLSFPYNLLCIGERFGNDAATAALLQRIRHEKVECVLIPGCYLGNEDVQFWLRRGVERLEGIDVYSLDRIWNAAVPALREVFGTEVHFRQAAIESLPFPDGSFDLIATSAVLEHVQNLAAMARETSRVLRPGGWAIHHFGPLYYSFGADHCIAAYGEDRGYDHLLLDEDEYRRLIGDQTFFDRQSDPNLPFWARRDQFSFAEPCDYLALFREYFEIQYLVVKISEEGLRFRSRHPDRWAQLRAAGLSEEALLVKGMSVVLSNTRGLHQGGTSVSGGGGAHSETSDRRLVSQIALASTMVPAGECLEISSPSTGSTREYLDVSSPSTSPAGDPLDAP